MTIGLEDITYYPDLSTPESNLAMAMPYVAANGQTIGYGGTNCAPLWDDLQRGQVETFSGLEAVSDWPLPVKLALGAGLFWAVYKALEGPLSY